MSMGAILLLIAGLVVTRSAWTAPLIIAGVVMIVIAWCGSRLDGRLVLQWGNSGAKLEFRAGIASPHRQEAQQSAPKSGAPRLTDPLLADGDVTVGEAHTVEIDLAELKALIVLAEAARDQDRPRAVANGSSNPSAIPKIHEASRGHSDESGGDAV